MLLDTELPYETVTQNRVDPRSTEEAEAEFRGVLLVGLWRRINPLCSCLVAPFADCRKNDLGLLCAYFSYAEQLVLYMKAEEFLSSALHTAKESIKRGQLLPSATVKQGESRTELVSFCRFERCWVFILYHEEQELLGAIA